MPSNDQTREDDLRQLLTEAIEVQLAALRAGISFWSEWIEQTSAFVQSATKTLSSIGSDDQATKDSVLELVDAGRASVRSLTEIPKHTAQKFLEELDKLAQQDAANAPAKAAAPAGASKRPRPRRRTGRVKT